jgi:hypothetical protein
MYEDEFEKKENAIFLSSSSMNHTMRITNVKRVTNLSSWRARTTENEKCFFSWKRTFLAYDDVTINSWKFHKIRLFSSQIWKKNWWMSADWLFRASIIFFASGTSITMCWSTVKKVLSLKKHEMHSLLSEKRSCMLLLIESIDNCEINSLIDTI